MIWTEILPSTAVIITSQDGGSIVAYELTRMGCI